MPQKRLRFWEELQLTLTSLQHEYLRSKSLTIAMGMCQTEKTTRYLMANIQNIVKSEDPDGQLAYFCANNPYHICVRLANLCYNTFKYNAVFIEREGADSFVTNLDQILYDLQIDIDLARKEHKKFHKVEKLPLVGLVLAFGGPWFMSNYIPGLRFYYNDGFGFLSGIISLVVVVGAYLVATRLNDKDRSQEDVTALEIRLMEKESFRNAWSGRVGDRRNNFQNLIDTSLSYLTPEMIMLRKTVFGLSAFVITIVLIIGYLHIERRSLEENFQTVPEAAMSMLAEHFTDYNFVIRQVYNDPYLNDEESILHFITIQGWNLSELELQLLAAQVANNNARIQETRFTPLHIFVSLFVMFLAYNIPEFLLKRRAKMVKVEAKAEVLLLQSVVIQLMHTPLKLKDYLIFFASISRLYAGVHLYSYIRQFNFPEDLKESAYKMFDPNYYQLMEQLYTLHSSMKAPDIFRETASSRRYLAQKFLEFREEVLATNFSWLSALLKAALLAPVVLQIVLPLASFVMQALEQYSIMMPQ